MELASTTLINLFSVSLNKYHLLFDVNPWLVVGVVLLALLFIFVRWRFGKMRGPNFEIDAAEMGIGPGKISFKPNLKDQEIAYKIWVELSTRKIGLDIDLKHDVIAEVYDSWHSFFLITRELIKDIPVNKVKNKSTREIIALSINVLNKGLRPHLTTWQARFRHWYERQIEKKEDSDIDPQFIQAKYPQFEELKTDLLEVNKRLIAYRKKMHELVLGKSKDGEELSEKIVS
ncbi:MAG: hypothetical protein WC657_03440 [Candidatus Paceibacterota bacterium]|jgi:hypothetical protein